MSDQDPSPLEALDSASVPVLVNEIEALGRWISRVRAFREEVEREHPLKWRAYHVENDVHDLVAELGERYRGVIPGLYEPIEGRPNTPPTMAVIRRVIRHLEHRSEG